MTDQPPAGEQPFDPSLIGRYVVARTARRHRPGVILPPAGRSRRPRLALDDGQVVPLEPDWAIEDHPSLLRDRDGKVLSTTQRCSGRPTYRYGDLPARHLATKTMLRREHRKKPRPGQAIIAWYRLHKDWAPLYAIADAAPMRPLPTGSDAAWHAARTCSRCGRQDGSPLPVSPEGDRYCAPCHEDAAVERWIEQVRPVQLEMAACAREVLADSRVVLAGNEREGVYGTPYHVETLDGQVLLSATVRRFQNAEPRHPDEYAKTTYVRDLAEQIRELGARRVIGWYYGALSRLTEGLWKVGDDPSTVPQLGAAAGDALGERYRLWCAVMPGHRTGFWYDEPKLPWNWGSGNEGERGYKTAQTAQARVHWIREYLRRMAEQDPPEPVARGGRGQTQ